ncbi:MAG: hypothetical protein K2M31_08520, partial [Muribaculaceae bacterium]|nr:hypothetical protein [Muribaculaceae bacterium]
MTLLNHQTLTYPDLERLILTYPQTHGAPISDDLLTALILPRLDSLLKSKTSKAQPDLDCNPIETKAKEQDQTQTRLKASSDLDSGSIEMRVKAPELSKQEPTPTEQYLLLANHLIRRSPRLLP